MDEYTHWLRADAIPGSEWKKVTKEEWVRAERNAGFHPNAVDVGQYATGGFGNGSISGSLTRDGKPPRY